MARSPRTERALLALSVALALAGPALAEAPRSLAFARHGDPVATRSLDALKQAVAASEVRVIDPYWSAEVVFDALPLAAVLDHVYGKSWRSEEELLFTCSDGYQPTVPVRRVLDHQAWIAFGRPDAPFTIYKWESGDRIIVELDPFYLVWENLDDEKVRNEADYGWPYQLVGIDLIRTRDRFPRMQPPQDAPEAARAGFQAFRVHCSRCHKVNGEGGGIGPELIAGSSPLAYRDAAYLRQWIEEPAKIRPNSRMPALNPKLPDRAGTVDAILAYLTSMRSGAED